MSRRALWLSCLLSVLPCVPSLAQPADAAKSAPPKETTVVATGTARVERAPDYVDVMLGKTANDVSASAAHAAAMKAVEAAAVAIKALKLEGEDLQTGSVDLSPRYERRPSDEEVPKIVGYVGSITLRIRTKDLKAVPRIIDAALAAGCNRVDYVQFGIKEAIAAREEAVKLATAAAKRKAAVMAEALELRITRVVEAGTNSHQYGGWYGGNRISQMANSAPNEAGGGGEGGGEGGVVPGKIEVWADATVTFGAAEKK